MVKEFQSGTIPPAVSFGAERVSPPGGLYLSRDDAIQLESWGAVAGVTLGLRTRVLRPDGHVVNHTFSQNASSDRTRVFNVFPGVEGFLLSLIVVEGTTVAAPGQVFARVSLVRGPSASALRTALLCEGYITRHQSAFFPPGRQLSPVEGPGIIRTIVGTDPAANVQISETVPTNARWKLLALYATLVTDATAANRRVFYQFDDGVSEFYQTAAASDQVASLTRRHILGAAGHGHDVFSTTYLHPLPIPLLLREGYRIRTATTGMQAGDNWSAPVMLVEEWLEP